MAPILTKPLKQRLLVLVGMGPGWYVWDAFVPKLTKAQKETLAREKLVEVHSFPAPPKAKAVRSKKGEPKAPPPPKVVQPKDVIRVTPLGMEAAFAFLKDPETYRPISDVTATWAAKLASHAEHLGVDLDSFPRVFEAEGGAPDPGGNASSDVEEGGHVPGSQRGGPSETSIPPTNGAVEIVPEVLARVKEAYGSVKDPGGIATIADMRVALDDVPDHVLDAHLVHFHEGRAELVLLRREDQRSLTDADRSGEIVYKGDPKHLVMRVG